MLEDVAQALLEGCGSDRINIAGTLLSYTEEQTGSSMIPSTEFRNKLFYLGKITFC